MLYFSEDLEYNIIVEGSSPGGGNSTMTKKTIEIEKPKFPVIRYRVNSERNITLDLRGIRDPHNPLQGRTNPSQGGERNYLTPEHLQCMVDEYWESCMGPAFDKYGNLVKDDQGRVVKTQVKPFTMSGLALRLGVSTQTLRKYRDGRLDTILDEMKAETSDKLTFSKVILRAKQVIEAYAEGRLYDRDGSNGGRFVLDCCFGWVDRQTRSNIKKAKADAQLRRDEFELKKQLLDAGDDDDNITINIVRGRKDES